MPNIKLIKECDLFQGFPRTGTWRCRAFKFAKANLDHLSGVTGWRIHDLRRTVVTVMAWLGVPPHVADKILNHLPRRSGEAIEHALRAEIG